jgi:hypothetical protein
MKTIASLAIAGLIQQAINESVPAVEKLSQRLAMLICPDNLQSLIDGVPVAVRIMDANKFQSALAKALNERPEDVRLQPGCDITVTPDGGINIPSQYRFTCYAASEEKAKEYGERNDYYNGCTKKTEEYPFPYQGWRSNSRCTHIGKADEWGLEVERF